MIGDVITSDSHPVNIAYRLIDNNVVKLDRFDKHFVCFISTGIELDYKHHAMVATFRIAVHTFF